MSLDPVALKKAAAQLPKPAAVQRFVALLVQGQPPGTPTLPQYDPVNGILTVQQVNIGNGMRLRALPNGGTLEILGMDGLWHSQVHWTTPSGT